MQTMIQGKVYEFYRSPRGRYTDKFNRMVKLATMADELIEKFDAMILRGKGVTETARLALACKLLITTGIRVGNESSAEGYVTKPHPNSKAEPRFVQTFGLTTLLPEHVAVKRGIVYLHFLGKRQIENSFKLDRATSQQVRRLYDTVTEGTLFDVSAYELTKFIKRSVGKGFSPKDFRTLRANMCAYEKLTELMKRKAPSTKKEQNAEVREVCEYVSENLNNTPSVCKASYIDTEFWEACRAYRAIVKKQRNKK